MKRLFSWLLKPWMLGLLGVILLSLILWFEGPLLAFNGREPFASENVRWTFIIIFFVVWAVYFIWKFIAAKIANAKLMKAVAGEDQPPPPPAPGAKETAAELEVLGKRLHEAMNVLKKTKLGDKHGGLYQLPWYMFVGAPGTGKTTALVHSGLKFPLAESMGKGSVGGVGGTRNCDWWFTDEAVLLDTAGRYTTQDSYTEVDKAAWGGFLQLLRKHRRRRPVNGVIIALSIADLLQQSGAARQTQAQAIRERIRELHERLGIRFPIYVIVTKCDLLAGFVEFFDNLGREERSQVWGVTFPLADANQVDAALAAFPAEFQLLEQQLQMRVFARIQQERDIQRRALLYGFPQQFAGVGEALSLFLNDVFQSTRYEEKALLRGVYFTSGTQEGSPIDRVMNAMAASFGLDRHVLPPNASSGRSYFITKLLREVIFPEANLAGVNLGLERKRRLMQWGATIAIIVLFSMIFAGLITSYFRNQRYVASVDHQVSEINKLAASLLPTTNDNILQALPLLDAIRNLPAGYAERDQGVPLTMRFGLYQGDKLGAGAQTIYKKMLRQTLLPYVKGRMENELRRGTANDSGYLFEVLRAYLMLNDAKHFDRDSVVAWIEFDSDRNLKASDAQRQSLSNHVQALLDDYNQDVDEPPVLNGDLISDTRLALAQMSTQQRIYAALKRELLKTKLTEFSVANVGGRDALQALTRRSGQPLTRGINGMFTVAGYTQFIAQANQAIADVEQDNWVLARQEAVNSNTTEQIKTTVMQLYYDDYIKKWDELLGDVTVVSFDNLDQSARITNILAGADSPLRKFLMAAAKETTLEGAKNGKVDLSSVTNSVKGKLDAYKNKLASAVGSDADEQPAPKEINPVDKHFEDLHKMVGMNAGVASPPGTPVPLDAVLAMLKDVSNYLDAAGAAKRTGTPSPPSDALSKLKLEADGKPAPLGAVLQNVVNAGASLTSGGERERLNSLWAAGAQACRNGIDKRYPLVRSAVTDVLPKDFGAFFASGGYADDFFQKSLYQYVEIKGTQWRWRSTATDASIGISQEVLNQFQRAQSIKNNFFDRNGNQVSLSFSLKPLSVDPSLTKVVLEIDGQQLNYAANTPAQPTSFKVPSGKGDGQVHLETVPTTEPLSTTGPWAFFHFIDKGTLESTPQQPEKYKLTFKLAGKTVSFELKADSVDNPFKRDTLEQFRCIDNL
jgi:type VI secretion system protein ImpL